MWRLIGALALVAAVAGGLWKAYDLGAEAERAKAEATLAAWKASVIEQANERRARQQARYEQLQGEFDELRSRPAKVREVIRTVEVRPDDRCESLPREFRCLFHAAPDDCMRALRAAPEAAGLDDAGEGDVAEPAR